MSITARQRRRGEEGAGGPRASKKERLQIIPDTRHRFSARKRVTFYGIMSLSRAKPPPGTDIECELAWCETRDKSPRSGENGGKKKKEKKKTNEGGRGKIEKEQSDNHANGISHLREGEEGGEGETAHKILRRLFNLSCERE